MRRAIIRKLRPSLRKVFDKGTVRLSRYRQQENIFREAKKVAMLFFVEPAMALFA